MALLTHPLVFALVALSHLPGYSSPFARAADFDPLQFVDPLIGSTNGGNVFAGASLPYGLAKASADVDGQNTGGFATDGSNVTGFSAVHDSGTGGNPSLGNFPLFPQPPCPGDDLNACRFRINERKVSYVDDSVVARPGYFSLKLANGVSSEMTAARRAALFRFQFPRGSGSDSLNHPMILLDLRDLWQSRQNASVVVDAVTGRMTGNGTFLPSFGAGSYVMHFCVDFFGADIFDSGVWVNGRAGTNPKQIFVTRGFNLFYIEAGAFVRFQQLAQNNTVTARVGISFISADQACKSAETEVPDASSGGFSRLVAAAEDSWREKLSVVSVVPGDSAASPVTNTTSTELQTIFWSGLYRTMMSPQNYTGENPYWDSGIPYFDSYYCIWDSFRAQHPLLSIIDPVAQIQMLRSLLDIYQHEGWLPDCHMATCNGWTQGGSNADIVLVDAYVKNLTASDPSFDWNLALEAIINDAENEPLEWSRHGRGGLTSWKNLGYIPQYDFDPYGFGTDSRSVSRTLEYSYNDFCLATLAVGLGKSEYFVMRYWRRAMNWQNLWRADQSSIIQGRDSGFMGFFQPRHLNGTFGYQDPIACSALAGFCSLTSNPSETFEASIWQYQFIVPQSIATLIAFMGGDDAFIRRLTYFHSSPLADISNEPVFSTVYLYHYAGRPGLSSSLARSYVPSSFNASRDGLPGNDDSGAMGAFLVFSMLGLFPVPGQDVYLISAPFFDEVSVKNPLTGKTATVRRKEGRGVFVQSATVDGVPWTKSWIGHRFFAEGGTLELVLGPEENTTSWGSALQDRPPSWAGLPQGNLELEPFGQT